MRTLRLPFRVPERDAMRKLLDAERLPDSLAGEVFVTIGGDLMFASESVADELVKQILVDRDAADLALVGLLDPFIVYAYEAAERYGVLGRVHRRRAVEVGV